MLIELLLGMAQVVAQPASSTPVVNETLAAKSPPKLYCESTPVMGSRIQKRRVCYTKEQFERYKRDIYTMLDRKQRLSWFEG